MKNGFFISSIPKSGTHLVSSLIKLHSGCPVVSVKEKRNYSSFDFSKYSSHENLVGHYRLSHIKRNESLCSLFLSRKVIVVIRDPRDLCNSMLHYVFKSSNPIHVSIAKSLEGLSYEDQIIKIANGIKGNNEETLVPRLDVCCHGFVELLDFFNSASLIKYEDFFEVDNISKKISGILSLPSHEASLLVKNAVSSDSKTKRANGATAFQWRGLYSENLKEYFRVNFSETIKYLGYEV